MLASLPLTVDDSTPEVVVLSVKPFSVDKEGFLLLVMLEVIAVLATVVESLTMVVLAIVVVLEVVVVLAVVVVGSGSKTENLRNNKIFIDLL